MLHRMYAMDDLPLLSNEDATVLELCSETYLERCSACNQNARRLADWLMQQPAVQCVYYPGLTRSGDDDVFAAVARKRLLSFNPSLHHQGSQLPSFPVDGSPATGYHVPGKGCLLSFLLEEHVSTQVHAGVLHCDKHRSI